MTFQVTLASGKEVETTVVPGASVSDLRQQIAEKLEQHPKSIELNAGRVLADEDVVPDAQITVVLVRLPWVGAPEDHVKDLGGGEFEIVGEEKKGSSKYNALCGVGFSSGKEYFEVQVIEGSGAFIGVTTKAGFAEGYKIKGLFFGGPGNLSNGSAGLKTSFGEPVKKGSVIGVTLDLTDEATVGVSFWQGGTSIGEAFKGCPRQPGAMVFPAVCASKVHDRFVLSLRRSPPKEETKAPHPAEGCWDLQRLVVGGELVNLDAALAIKGKGKGRGYVDGDAAENKGHIIMSVNNRGGGHTFQLSMPLGNILNTTVQVTSTPDGTEMLQVGGVMSTMVMSPPPLMDLEQRLSRALPLITRWSIKDSRLELRGGDVELDFLHYDAPPEEPVADVTLP